MARWLKAHARSTDTVLAEPIGHVGYYSGLRVLDPVGLVTPAVLRYYTSETPAPILAAILELRPDWCVLRPGELARFRAAALSMQDAWRHSYRLVATFSYAPGAHVYYVFRRRSSFAPSITCSTPRLLWARELQRAPSIRPTARWQRGRSPSDRIGRRYVLYRLVAGSAAPRSQQDPPRVESS